MSRFSTSTMKRVEALEAQHESGDALQGMSTNQLVEYLAVLDLICPDDEDDDDPNDRRAGARAGFPNAEQAEAILQRVATWGSGAFTHLDTSEHRLLMDYVITR